MTATEKQIRSRSQPDRFDVAAAILVSLAVGFAIGTMLPSRKGPGMADQFHTLYHDDSNTTWKNTYWLGAPIEKIPLDAWIYQEVIYETHPDVILEMGTLKGGSALYFASICDLTGSGRVVTVDIERQPNLPRHPRITYLLGSSTSDAIVSQIKSLIQPGERVMAVLDSDHRKAHVLDELRIYSQIVTPGQYLVAEDTDINGHPVNSDFGPGPFEAVRDFLGANHDYVQDRSREKFKVTSNPGGWLKRVH